MKKLRLTNNEYKEMLKDILIKYSSTGVFDISSFEYTKKDVQEFIKKLSNNTVKKPTLRIDVNAYTKMYELVRQSSIELQWHMLIKRDKEKAEYTIYDIMLFPQTNSGTSTTTDQDEFAEWQMKLIQDLDFPIEDLRGHGHSHVNMNVYSSGIDDAYQRELITKLKDGDYYIFLVLNKKMEMFALIYDFDQQIIFETKDIDIQITNPDGDIRAWCSEQIKKYCNTAKPKQTYSYYSPKSDLKIDSYKPKEEELVYKNQKPRPFGRRK